MKMLLRTLKKQFELKNIYVFNQTIYFLGAWGWGRLAWRDPEHFCAIQGALGMSSEILEGTSD